MKMRLSDSFYKALYRPSYFAAIGFLLSCLTAWGAGAPDAAFLSGNEAYGRGDYKEAVKCYQQCLQQGHSSEIYNNLGMAYEKLEEVGRAVLHYERGLYFFPGASILKDALQRLYQNKNIPQYPLPCYQSIFLSLTFDVWVIGASLCFWFAIIAAIFWKYYKRQRVVWLFSFSLMALSMSLLAIVVHFDYRKRGIVLATTSLKIAPTKDSPTGVVVGGGEEGILQSWQKGYAFVHFSGNKEGWLEDSLFTLIVPPGQQKR